MTIDQNQLEEAIKEMLQGCEVADKEQLEAAIREELNAGQFDN